MFCQISVLASDERKHVKFILIAWKLRKQPFVVLQLDVREVQILLLNIPSKVFLYLELEIIHCCQFMQIKQVDSPSPSIRSIC